MIRVNLLPWRAERRRAQRKQLGMLGGLVAVLALGIIGMVHIAIADRISTQEGRNAYLKAENGRLDKEIAEISKLRQEIAALLARKQVIERLQADRSQVVHLLDQLVRQTPEGIYLKTLKQTGLLVNMTGYAQSNARVSTLMRNIMASPYLDNPVLVEIKAALVNGKRVSEFNLNVNLKQVGTGEADKAAKASPAAKKG